MAKKLTANDLLDQLILNGRTTPNDTTRAIAGRLKSAEIKRDREAMLNEVGLGALAGGVLALLVGGKGGRQAHHSLLDVGGLAALGKLALQVYTRWSSQLPEPVEGEAGLPFGDLSGDAVARRSQILLKAMVAAAFADGHITRREHEEIEAYVDAMNASEELQRFFRAELKSPATPDLIGLLVDEPVAACEVYLLSAGLIEPAFAADRAYLDRLARALRLPPALAAQLESVSEQT